jgi:outer membrane protein
MFTMRYILLFLCLLLEIVIGDSKTFANQTLALGDNQGEMSSVQNLTLAQCITMVLATNPGLAISEADLFAKEESVSSARKDLYPSLSTFYTYMKELDGVYQPQEDFHSYGVTAEQPLYMGKSLITAIAVSELDKNNAELARQQNINNLVLQTYQTYYNLLNAQKLEEVASQAVERLQAHRKDAQAFYDAGLIPKNDLLASELQLAQGQQDLLKAENATSLAMSALNLLLERPATMPLTVTDRLIYTKRNIEWDEVVQLALTQRPEIKQGELTARIAEKNIILTKAPYLPTVSLSATYTRQSEDFLGSSNPSGPNEIKSAQAQAQWKFWSWQQKKNKVAAARLEVKKAKEFVRQVRDTVILEVREAFLSLLEAEKNITVAQKSIEQAEENYRITQGRFQSQLATSTEVLDAQTLLTTARSNYYNALYGYNTASAFLDRASGTLGLRYGKNLQ